MAFTPDSCRSIQSITVHAYSDTRFGIPEHLRIPDAIIGQHEERGITGTFFRKPSPSAENGKPGRSLSK
jgi:hypothetical protein